MFKLWSEIKKEAKEELAPNFGSRGWDELSSDEKYLVWKYLRWHFFEENPHDQSFSYNNKSCNYKFFGDYIEQENTFNRVVQSIAILNLKYKAKSYARNFLEDSKFNSACQDFYEIFSTENEGVVLELLSLYSKAIISERNKGKPNRNEEESDGEFKNRVFEWRWEIFDRFTEDVNEVFLQFGVKYHLTRSGFVPRQDERIMNEIYAPVLTYLSDPKWTKVNEILADAFSDYRKNTREGYSGCVTKTITTVEAFLQILVEEKTGGTKLSSLISKAQKESFIPNDVFTQTIFKNINSILARERMATGDGHPKNEYATEKNARIILNLAMVFMQHCIQK